MSSQIDFVELILSFILKQLKYERLLGGKELVESSLHRYLAEHLNAEILLGTITDVAVAMDWIRSTFLYIRGKKNPRHYNIPPGLTSDAYEAKLQGMAFITFLTSFITNVLFCRQQTVLIFQTTLYCTGNINILLYFLHCFIFVFKYKNVVNTILFLCHPN